LNSLLSFNVASFGDRMIVLPMSSMLDELSQALSELGRKWAHSEFRPRISDVVKTHWDALLDEWVSSDLPLIVRKGGGVRGSVIVHGAGRKIVISDNSPAQWAFNRAFARHFYTLTDIRGFIDSDTIPHCFATKIAEKPLMSYKCTLSSFDKINKLGWKLCHIRSVGLNTKTPIQKLPMELLHRHFRLLMAPSNHFVVPLIWAGLGEVPELIKEIRVAESMEDLLSPY
jgi:hypothetical protein